LRLPTTLDIEADCIHHAESTGDGIGDGLVVVDVGFDRLKLGIIQTKELVPPLRMP
jgi:hypothetical protein